MPSRLERTLRALAYGLAAILLVQLVLLAVRQNPLAGLEVPTPPRWSPDTKNPPGETGSTAPLKTTNVLAGATNQLAGTNTAASTNLTGSTNTFSETNGADTPHSVVPPNTPGGTNLVAVTNLLPGTNLVAGTNAPAQTNLAVTNLIAAAPSPIPPRLPMGGPGPLPMRPPRPLPPVSQARIDRITSSEMLAPVFRPPPMALLGIAGHHAFIRTPSGQSALLREGGESDGIKLLRLGTNRVLIEQAGEKKELIIFDGFGSPSLLTP